MRLKTQIARSLVKGSWRDLFPNTKLKTSGSALLISILLGGLMLTVGIMSARMAVREVGMSADLFLSEKAYFSAESGVEKSLLLLKNEPLAHTQSSNDLAIGDPNTTTSIRNLINTTPGDFPLEEFSFTLGPLESQKWRFRYDNNPALATSEQIVTGSLRVELDTSGSFFWRFLCQDPSNTTQALQATQSSTSVVPNLLAVNGKTDDGADFNYGNWTGINKDTCYISVQNLATNARTYTFSGTQMAPHAAHIHSVGWHQGREKHIRFDYAQKTLGSLFDFSFLHSDGGL